ncbi:unnamed protein product, partial [Mesorhabditis spiculigera]
MLHVLNKSSGSSIQRGHQAVLHHLRRLLGFKALPNDLVMSPLLPLLLRHFLEGLQLSAGCKLFFITFGRFSVSRRSGDECAAAASPTPLSRGTQLNAGSRLFFAIFGRFSASRYFLQWSETLRGAEQVAKCVFVSLWVVALSMQRGHQAVLRQFQRLLRLIGFTAKLMAKTTEGKQHRGVRIEYALPNNLLMLPALPLLHRNFLKEFSNDVVMSPPLPLLHLQFL